MRERASSTLPAPVSGAPGRAQLTVRDVSKAYGLRPVLDQVSFTVRPGERAAVIGENGSGKSTLLRLIAGEEAPDSGEITAVAPGGTGHLAQTLDRTFPGLGPDHTVRDTVDAALAGLRELERRLRAAEERLGADPGAAELTAYGDLLTAFEERGGYAADARVDAALHGLGVGSLGRDRTLGTLSGGERSRLALACVLAAGPELLLLDEPTNHLDRRAVEWLEDRLRAHRGTVVAVTHDRAFLEGVATTVLEVDRDTRSVRRYGDGWAGYRTAKAAARRRRQQEYEEYLDELARTEEQVAAAGHRLATTGKDPAQGFGKHRRSHEAKLSGQVRAARQRLERLRREPVQAPPEPLRFRATPTTPTTPAASAGPVPAASASADSVPAAPRGPVAELTDVVVAGRLRIAALRVESGGRLLVTGPNGAGKTTLLRVLAGELRPDGGTVHHPGRVRVGYLPQELPPTPARRPEPLLSAYAAGRPGHPDEYEDELLGLGLFRSGDLAVPVGALSIGQQRRLALARLVVRPADLLVLDEPTNHVALSLVEELEEALGRYEGAVVAVSHDRRFRGGFGGRRLELRSGCPAD
ncbi:ABC-F family ATP-binding cassette domain-containing protein [Streptomyces qinzhouensis]|uniref:ABC-F family ATP-binding cassette domain-containing protein n=1 Tax=Streptomyces qinzhouensis TaxID=2599401 RepID=A0A5B8JA37_9ACTN|nr:ABC-F family ATP-binding cassette domain-containing protein [Streptomyces qinzhouensis]QDY78705.1 ABC-F family ATP-binding cassette domain-containing protein [Streptomyces qinzhouensis]